jgi:diketogulonate reductase-like aldo/keto reductase
VPLLVHVATNDTDVDFEEAEPLIYKLNALKPHLAETKIYVDPAPWGARAATRSAAASIRRRSSASIRPRRSIRGTGPGRSWSDTSTDPKAGLELAFSRLRTDMIDLMMVHNLGGTDTLMPHMKEMKEAGRFRYLGISTSSDRQYDDLAAIMRREPLDFIEIDYSLGNRSAEQTMLPLAQERGMAVLINVPFGGRNASMLQEVAGQPLPEWASEIGATSWAQLFLKWIVSHPAVTVVIPGTTRVEHAIDNNSAARGVLPDAAMRRRIEQHYDSIVG